MGARGIISSTTIQKHFQSSERTFDWISALRSVQIRTLVEQESIQLSLFDEQNIADISSDDYPGERLIACRNPMLAADRAKTREELLQATEKELAKSVAATMRKKNRLTGASNIAWKVGKVVNRYQVARAFQTRYSREQLQLRKKHPQYGKRSSTRWFIRDSYFRRTLCFISNRNCESL